MADSHEDEPITLQEACDQVFRGKVSPATLRGEAARGKLRIFRIGNRNFTTLKAVREMLDRCQMSVGEAQETAKDNQKEKQAKRVSEPALDPVIARLRDLQGRR